MCDNFFKSPEHTFARSMYEQYLELELVKATLSCTGILTSISLLLAAFGIAFLAFLLLWLFCFLGLSLGFIILWLACALLLRLSFSVLLLLAAFTILCLLV